MFSSHSFWTSSSLDVPAGVTQKEGHTGFFIPLLSAVRALMFLARRIQPFLSLVDREVEFCVLTISSFSTRWAFLFLFFSFLGRLLCIRKTYTKMDQIRFFRVFSILWVREWSRFVWPNPFELFVTGLQTDLVPKSVCSSDTNLQTDFARGATITTFGQ